MTAERQRFKRLVRHFAYRFVDHDLVASDAGIHETLANVLALLASLSVIVAFGLVTKYFFVVDDLPPAARQSQLWVDQEFLISLVMTAVGFFTVLGWDALFPDRRDALGLGALGVRPGAFLGARLCAIALFVALIVAATVSFLALAFPFLIAGPKAPVERVMHAAAANLVTLAAAGCFAFLSLFALRGVLVLLFSYRLQQRLSAWIQMSVMIALLVGLFLLPNPEMLRRGPAWLGEWLPSYWFLSLEQNLLLRPQPLPWDFSWRALEGLAAAAFVAVACFAAGYRRMLRSASEEGELSPRRRRLALAAALARRALPRPRERAAFLFTARTMLRSRKHRLLLAIYCAVGLAWVGAGLSRLIQHPPRGTFQLPTPALASIPFDLAFALLLGARVLFSTPVELSANWIFRMNQGGGRNEYFSGVRKLLLVLAGVPLALAPLPIFVGLWGPGPALRHSLFFLLAVAWFIELLMWDLRKIPFTCSALPGRANLKLRLPVYFGLLTALSTALAILDTHLARHPDAFLVWAGGAALAYVAFRWITTRTADPFWRFQWEERHELFTRLDLAR